jgi:hypothetical protein
VGVVISAVQIIQAQGTPPEDLEVALMSIDASQPITGTIVDATGNYPDQPTDVGATPVDITLKNSGGKPSDISRIDAEVLFFEEMDDCTRGGAGPAMVSANYSIKLPTDETGQTKIGTYSTDTRFEVKPGAVDRMVVTLGPEEQSLSSSRPKVMAVRLTLIHDGGQKLDAGTVSVATTSENVERQVAETIDSECAEENLQVLDTLFAVQAIRSGELERLHTGYASYA